MSTLETVLATARRGGLHLVRLQMDQGDGVDTVSMELAATDPELLDLFCHRLRNLLNVFAIET